MDASMYAQFPLLSTTWARVKHRGVDLLWKWDDSIDGTDRMFAGLQYRRIQNMPQCPLALVDAHRRSYSSKSAAHWWVIPAFYRRDAPTPLMPPIFPCCRCTVRRLAILFAHARYPSILWLTREKKLGKYPQRGGEFTAGLP